MIALRKEVLLGVLDIGFYGDNFREFIWRLTLLALLMFFLLYFDNLGIPKRLLDY